MERRELLQKSLWFGGLSLLAPIANAAVCGVTPAQTPGPFYPGEAKFVSTHDLTRLSPERPQAQGEIVHLHGQVIDESCQPVRNANVEIWQACHTGRYNNPHDPNPAKLDPDFRYWGEAFTDEDGKFYFKTIKPGAYPADAGWDRPPHIHVRVSRLGYRELVTQMYFAGEALNDQDLILQGTPAETRGTLIVPFTSGLGPDGSPGLSGEFIVSLQAVRR